MNKKSGNGNEWIRLCEDCMWITLRRLLDLEDMEGAQKEGLTWIMTSDRNDGYNCVFDLDLDPEPADRELDRALSRFRDRGRHSWWWVGPTAQPKDLGQRLAARGFRKDENLTCMALDLTKPLPRAARPKELELTLIRDTELLQRMMDVFCPAVNIPPAQGRQAFESILTESGQPDPAYRHHVGLKEGRVACSSSYFRMKDVIALDYVSTDPDFRRKGYGRAVFLNALKGAVQEGCTGAVLLATEMGRPLYSSLGFREVGTMTIWTDSPQEKDVPA